LVSKKNQEGRKVEIPQGTRVLKLLTPTHFIAVTHNADGEVSRLSGGGNHTSRVTRLRRSPSLPSAAHMIWSVSREKSRSFRCKIVGNKWYHSGTLSNGGTIDGEWERVEKDQ
jgi:hypothetical protein